MSKRKEPIKLTFTEVVPELAPEERARRIERFYDTMAKSLNIDGYIGCKCSNNCKDVDIYIAK